jgi:hypothetical protein
MTQSDTLDKQAELLNRLKIKLAINRYLTKGLGERYLSKIGQCFATFATKELLASVIVEMQREGLLAIVRGRRGGMMLVRRLPSSRANEPVDDQFEDLVIEDLTPRTASDTPKGGSTT